MLRTTRTPSSDLRFRGSNRSLATSRAVPSGSSSSKSASVVCSVAAIVWTRSPSQRTGCLRGHGIHRVAAMAAASGLSPRQFERRFLAQVGAAQALRSNHQIQCRLGSQAPISQPCLDLHRQRSELLRSDALADDCRAFTAESPARFLAQLEGLPAFHTFFATQNRARDTDSDSLSDVASLLSGHAGNPYHP